MGNPRLDDNWTRKQERHSTRARDSQADFLSRWGVGLVQRCLPESLVNFPSILQNLLAAQAIFLVHSFNTQAQQSHTEAARIHTTGRHNWPRFRERTSGLTRLPSPRLTVPLQRKSVSDMESCYAYRALKWRRKGNEQESRGISVYIRGVGKAASSSITRLPGCYATTHCDATTVAEDAPYLITPCHPILISVFRYVFFRN